jgi:hypothetical protein
MVNDLVAALMRDACVAKHRQVVSLVTDISAGAGVPAVALVKRDQGMRPCQTSPPSSNCRGKSGRPIRNSRARLTSRAAIALASSRRCRAWRAATTAETGGLTSKTRRRRSSARDHKTKEECSGPARWILGKTTGAVKARQHRGLASLAKVLGLRSPEQPPERPYPSANSDPLASHENQQG